MTVGVAGASRRLTLRSPASRKRRSMPRWTTAARSAGAPGGTGRGGGGGGGAVGLARPGGGRQAGAPVAQGVDESQKVGRRLGLHGSRRCGCSRCGGRGGRGKGGGGEGGAGGGGAGVGGLAMRGAVGPAKGRGR